MVQTLTGPVSRPARPPAGSAGEIDRTSPRSGASPCSRATSSAPWRAGWSQPGSPSGIIGAFRAAPSADASAARGAAAASLAEYEEHRDTFMRHNLRLVVYVARRYRHLGLSLADLVQEGNLGLIRIVEKFDPERGISFSTYASCWLHQSMIRPVQRDSRTVRAPSGAYQDERASAATRSNSRCPSRSSKARATRPSTCAGTAGGWRRRCAATSISRAGCRAA